MKDFSDERSVLYYLSSIQKYVFKIVYETTVKEYDLHPGQIPILFLLEYKPGNSARDSNIDKCRTWYSRCYAKEDGKERPYF